MCPICKGSGEVSAGITGGTIGNQHSAHPTWIKPNVDAYDSRINDVWIVRENPLVCLWGIAICITCHGTGQILPSL